VATVASSSPSASLRHAHGRLEMRTVAEAVS